MRGKIYPVIIFALLGFVYRAHGELISHDFLFVTIDDSGPYLYPGIEHGDFGVGWYTYDPNEVSASPLDQLRNEYNAQGFGTGPHAVRFNQIGSEIVAFETGITYAELAGVSFDDVDLLLMVYGEQSPWNISQVIVPGPDPLWSLNETHLIDFVGANNVGPAIMYWYTDEIIRAGEVPEPSTVWIFIAGLLALLRRRVIS